MRRWLGAWTLIAGMIVLGGVVPATAAVARPTPTATPTPAPLNCPDYDAYEWAQSVWEREGGQGDACPALPHGAAPALWTTTLPTGLTTAPATNVQVLDAGTLTADVAGNPVQVRLLGITAPTAGTCFAAESARFAGFLVGLATRVILERDPAITADPETWSRDVWLEIAGQPYLLNEALVRSGYARAATSVTGTRYAADLIAAEAFAKAHALGLWTACTSNPAAPQDRVTTPTPTMAVAQGYNPEEFAYAQAAGRIAGDISTASTSLTALLANPTGTTEWSIMVAAQLAVWEAAYPRALALNPPPAFAAVHALFLQACQDYRDAAVLFARGLDTGDASLIDQAAALIQAASPLLAQASAEIDQITRSRGSGT